MPSRPAADHRHARHRKEHSPRLARALVAPHLRPHPNDSYSPMKVGLVGFAGSGKTTVFNTMTGLAVPTGYGGELRLGTVKVPDERIDALSKIYKPKKTTYAEIVFCDVPGEHGAERKGLSRKALQQIRDQEVLCLVLRAFPNPAARDGDPDPARRPRGVPHRMPARRSRHRGAPARSGQEGQARPARAGRVRIHEGRRWSTSCRCARFPPAALNRDFLKGYATAHRSPAAWSSLNRSEQEAAQPMPPTRWRVGWSSCTRAGLVLSASVEAEIAAMDPADRPAFLEDLGLKESALTRFIRTAYGLLDLISFFTVGEDEVRAWPIRRGTTARQAAGPHPLRPGARLHPRRGDPVQGLPGATGPSMP